MLLSVNDIAGHAGNRVADELDLLRLPPDANADSFHGLTGFADLVSADRHRFGFSLDVNGMGNDVMRLPSSMIPPQQVAEQAVLVWPPLQSEMFARLSVF